MKLNKKELGEILKELYLLDDSLKLQEQELIKTINNIINLQPEIKVNQDFIQRLRSEIMTEATSFRLANQSLDIINYNHMNKLVYSFYGAAVMTLVAVIAIVTVYGNIYKGADNELAVGQKTINTPKFSKLTESAFGSLGGVSTAGISSTLGMGGAMAKSSSPTAESGRSFDSTISANTVGAVSTMPAQVDSKMIMPPYEGKTYKFIYKGEELKLENKQLDVLKRVKGTEVNIDTNNLISGLGLNYVDLKTFIDQKIQNISFIQKGDFGYSINVTPEEGVISIYQNWETWPAAKCGSDMKCYESLRVKSEDVPADKDLIAIANQFVSEHSIDRSSYGEPEVNSDWRRQYEAVEDKANYYFPDSIEIVYPLKIDGKFVYDEYNGAKTGLSVYVQVRDKKVSSVNNLATQVYNTSAYEMETDGAKIIAYAEKGGMGGVMYWGENKIEDLELSDPEMVLVRQYIYKDGLNSELFVPALSFPIKNMPKDASFNRKAVIIPLAKEILDERMKESDGAGSPGRPMPMDAMVK